MTLEQDLKLIERQEAELRFDAFDLDSAWALGSRLVEMGKARGLGVAIDVTLHSMPAFYAALPGSTADNANWIRRKRNSVLRHFRSSYGLGLAMKKNGKTLADSGLSDVDFAVHGGSFPIIVRGTGCIGAVTVSGLPQREDHRLAVEALAAVLGVENDGINLVSE